MFRQDCAWAKRAKLDDWDRSSLFSRRTGPTGSRASRTGSLATKRSQRSLRDGRMSSSTQAPSERILSWRQGIASSPNVAGNGSVGRRSSEKHNNRSVSPRKSLDRRQRAANEPAEQRNDGKSTHPLANDVRPPGNEPPSEDTRNGERDPNSNLLVHRTEDNPLMVHGGQSYAFWDTNEWKARVKDMRESHAAYEYNHPLTPVLSAEPQISPGGTDHLAARPATHSVSSYVSRLTDERSSSADEFDDASEGHVLSLIHI